MNQVTLLTRFNTCQFNFDRERKSIAICTYCHEIQHISLRYIITSFQYFIQVRVQVITLPVDAV